jgi:AraC-like DNA-binding protein
MSVQITTHRSDLGRWRAAHRSAGSHVCDDVRGYFASKSLLPRPLHERHLPSRDVAIVLNFGAAHRIINPSDPRRTTDYRGAWIVAPQHRTQIREAFGSREFMVIGLTPIGAHRLLQVPMELLTNRIIALEDVDSGFSRLLTDQAQSTDDWAARFDLVEAVIAARLASAPGAPPGLLHSWRLLQKSPNQVDLARLPEEIGCSRRHLIAQFHRYVGSTPKMMQRIGRFRLAVAAVQQMRSGQLPYEECRPHLERPDERASTITPMTIGWADLALQCGYYDQSHFVNEFRSFSGLSPLEFLQRTL